MYCARWSTYDRRERDRCCHSLIVARRSAKKPPRPGDFRVEREAGLEASQALASFQSRFTLDTEISRARRFLRASSSNDQGVTTTVTFSAVISAPSCAIHRRTYSPGALKVARVSHLLSAGIGGVFQPTAHGEFAPLRVSCHAVNCGGSNVTSPAPRYFIHTSRSPVAESGTVRLPPRASCIGLTRGFPSSVAMAVSGTCSPAFTCRRRSPSILRTGGKLPARSGMVPVCPPAPKLAAITVALTT